MRASPQQDEANQSLRLFLCGDVMIGRGIDQVLANPCGPDLHERYVHSAVDYVRLAEAANGPIPRHVDPSYIWGAALEEWNRSRPDVRIVNLETSITRSQDYLAKGINYRMSPENANCLVAAAIDCCTLANNHVLDWGRRGLFDTLTTLQGFNIKAAGAGWNLDEAGAAATLAITNKGRVLVFAFASVTSGTPRNWASTAHGAGVNLLEDLSDDSATSIAETITRIRQPQDAIVVSIHWGPNWGYAVSDEQRHFAHALIDKADVSIVHGHSSHHAKAIEMYKNRLILYGCGDFLNDYEGICGYEKYRDDLGLMYFADIEVATGNVTTLDIVPLQVRRFCLERPSDRDIDWIAQTLNRESRTFGAGVARAANGHLTLSWPGKCEPTVAPEPRRVAH
jgi:poly-gamma-glutamate capsule biosynthesis protein CapA/YwtB (metallophosphatase superfamily)